VKRILLTVGLVAVALACCGRLLYAQQAAVPSGQMRVAIVNMGLVFTKYDKAVALKTQLERSVEPYKQEAEKLKKDMLSWAEAMKRPGFNPKDKEQYENGIRINQRKLEDMELTVRKQVGKQQQDQIVNLYKEINDAIQAYARSQGIQIVFGFGEQTDGDIYSLANITRKMQGMDVGGCNPLFYGPDVDISRSVIQYLNSNYQRAASVPSGNVTQTSGTLPANKK
jgi:Skp family chaperone for outer membrane proteins